MPHDVIMPALGMAQDKGVIVAWHKKPGDQIRADDVLMEIETDKATMEVEAGHDGFLVELRAGEGDAIPVGDVVAVISESAGDVGERSLPAKDAGEGAVDAAAAAADDEETTEAEGAIDDGPAREPEPEPLPRERDLPRGKSIAAGSDHGRILASPKAKLHAAERGIDLAALVRQGVAEPIHVADLDLYRYTDARPGQKASTLTAYVAREDFGRFAAWAEDESDGAVSRSRILAAFAAAALRRATANGADAPIVVSTLAPMNADEPELRADPDLVGLSEDIETAETLVPDLLLFDLTGSGLAGYELPRAERAALVIADDANGFRLSLQFDEAGMALGSAARLLSGFSARLADPLRQLL